MAPVDGAFWTELDARILAKRSVATGFAAAEIGAVPDVAGPVAVGDTDTAPARQGTLDWTGVLDCINTAKGAAEQQHTRLREQAAAHDDLIQELKRSRQRVSAFEILMREVQTQAEAKACQATANAEARVRAIQIEAEARVREAQERARAAESRAQAAEAWLNQIEQASRALLPTDRRAAA